MANKKILSAPNILFTDENCNFGGISRPGIGVLIDEHLNPVGEVSDYLISLRIQHGHPNDIGTIRQTAFDLRMFWEYLSRVKLNWRTEVNDNVLLGWRDKMLNGIRVSEKQKGLPNKQQNDVRPLKASTINRRISNVFRFYYWCKHNALVDDHVIGTGGPYSISAETKPVTGSTRWPFLLAERGAPAISIPNAEQISQIHDQLDKRHNKEVSARNRLFIQWTEHVGLRGQEAASLRVDMIPEDKIIEQYIQREERFPMDFSPQRQGVKTKGNYEPRYMLDVDPMLLKFTRDYIDLYRSEIVTRANKKWGRVYKDPETVFLSTSGKTLGKSLNAKTAQNAINFAFKEAGIDNTGHSFRKVFGMRVVSSLYILKLNEQIKKGLTVDQSVRAISDNDIITYASQQLRHRHKTTSLKHYIDLTKLKILKMSEVSRVEYLERQGRIIDQATRFFQDKPDKRLVNDILQAIDDGLRDALLSGDKSEVFEIMMKHLCSEEDSVSP